MGSSTAVDSLVHENIELLRSGLDVILSIPAALYRADHDRATNGGVGRHFRHIIEFYQRLLQSEGSMVDYESRPRDPRVERDPVYASSVVNQVIRALDALRAEAADGLRTVVTEVLDDGGMPVRTPSSVGRELAVLASHTVHHYAIIALLLRGTGAELPEHFGVAPSTLRYLAARES